MLKELFRKFGYEKASEQDNSNMSSGFNRAFTGGFANTPFARAVFSGETVQHGVRNKVDYNSPGSIDYYSLRTLSRKLFVENPYAGMALGRLVTNVINEGLKPEAIPSKFITQFNEEETIAWSAKTEELFSLWAEDRSADWEGVHSFPSLQKIAYMEALVEGDVLHVQQFDRKTKLPASKLIPGRRVANGTNSNDLKDKGNTVDFGVERDARGRHIAYHVLEVGKLGQTTFKATRILAKGKTTNRDVARLIYESPPPAGRVRGFPLLSRIMQKIDQVETYATYELEAAKVNAAIAAWVEKTVDKPGSGALRGVQKKSNLDSDDGHDTPETRYQAGLVVHEMQHGEKLQSFKTDRPNVNFNNFKDGVLEDIAAALEIPPEILQLKFGNNFSASRQAVIEFKSYIRKARKYFAEQFNKPVYNIWLHGMALRGMVQTKDYLSGIAQKDIFVINGWQRAKWVGFVKQNVDILKEAKAYEIYLENGLMTREQAASELTEADYRTSVDRLGPENEMLAKANEKLPGNINTSKSIVNDEEEDDDEKK